MNGTPGRRRGETDKGTSEVCVCSADRLTQKARPFLYCASTHTHTPLPTPPSGLDSFTDVWLWASHTQGHGFRVSEEIVTQSCSESEPERALTFRSPYKWVQGGWAGSGSSIPLMCRCCDKTVFPSSLCKCIQSAGSCGTSMENPRTGIRL